MTKAADANKLKAGLTLEKVQGAIAHSGYPLQPKVNEILRRNGFSVSPEWSYIDRDSDQLRAIDARASLPLGADKFRARVRPSLELLIECKQSEFPFVFFEENAPRHKPQFPHFVGLASDKFRIVTNDSLDTWIVTPQSVLDLTWDVFARQPPTAFTLSKCQRKGADLILSGDESYSSLILPLAKAMAYLKVAESPPKTAVFFDAHISLAIAVIDAPMVLAAQGKIRMCPWVRIIRHENSKKAEPFNNGQTWFIDMVHICDFERYLTENVIPFGTRSAEKILRHGTELAHCEGYVPGMKQHLPSKFEDILKPSAVASLGQAARAWQDIWSLFRKKPQGGAQYEIKY